MDADSDGLRLLCTADLHLGRPPSRVPPDTDELSVAEVWSRINEQALVRDVDAVLMAGDIVDRANRIHDLPAFGMPHGDFEAGAGKYAPTPQRHLAPSEGDAQSEEHEGLQTSSDRKSVVQDKGEDDVRQ